jgi:ubiquinone/menaquinone biosynthesis C-methylase UbiE
MSSKTPHSNTQESKVTAQFGPRAAAYVSSAVHASGEDLAQIAAVAKEKKPARALDMGCGGGHVSFHVAPHAGELVAYDLSGDMLEAVMMEGAARKLKNIVPQQGSVAKIPFGDGTFDFVASRYSAHHWHDVAAGLREARRVLKPGGSAVFTDAVSPGPALLDTHLQAIELLRDPSHVRDYSTAEWVGLLKAAGFTPGTPTLRRVRLEFSSWVARMSTPEIHVRAIRALQGALPQEVAAYFEMEEDGSFTIDAMTIEAQ